jgi:hypothetical protein
MQPNDYRQFAELWADAHEIMAGGKVFSKKAMDMIFETLEDHSLDMVEQAIKLHSKQSKFAPTPGDIIGILEAGNKRLTADEAWSMMPKDEFETIVWTREMAEAYGIASGLLAEGDKIAARMAFKGAYERLCSEALMMQRPVAWSVCVGFDKSRVEPVLQKAVAAGRISQDRANKFLPAPMGAGPIARLLAGKVTELPNNDANLKAKWGELKQAMADGQRKLVEKECQRNLEIEQKRLAFERHRQDMLNRVDERLQTKSA